jgi:hypothetical protein
MSVTGSNSAVEHKAYSSLAGLYTEASAHVPCSGAAHQPSLVPEYEQNLNLQPRTRISASPVLLLRCEAARLWTLSSSCYVELRLLIAILDAAPADRRQTLTDRLLAIQYTRRYPSRRRAQARAQYRCVLMGEG